MTATPNSSRQFRFRVGPWAVTLILLLANVAYFLNRGWEDTYYPTSYATIYYPTDRPVVREWREANGGIEADIVWDAPVRGWRVYRDGEFVSENDGTDIFFPSTEGADYATYLYEAVPQIEGDHPSLEFKLRFYPPGLLENQDYGDGAYSVVSDVPMADFAQYPVSEWIDDYAYVGEEGLVEIDRILRDEVGILPDDTVYEKLEKIMIFQRDDLGQQCRGQPPADFRWRTPWEIYQSMKSGEGQGFCAQHSQVFVLFANRAGLATRMVLGARTENHRFIYTGHTWVEAWFPDQQRWGWVEPSYAVIYVKDKKGQVLNSVELANLRQHEAWDGLTARVYKDWGWPDVAGETDTLVDAPFAQVNGVVERQFITSAIYKWRRPPNVEEIRGEYSMLLKDRTFFWGNLERYFFKPPLAYANYPTPGDHTYLVRHLLLWPFLISLGWSILGVMRAAFARTKLN